MSEITISELQQEVDGWIKSIGVRYFGPLTNIAQLSEEVGEVARLISRTAGEQSFKKGAPEAENPMLHLADELCDCLFVLTCLANQHEINLTEAWQRNIEKRTVRDKERHVNNPKLAKVAG